MVSGTCSNNSELDMKSDNTVPVVHFMCAALLYVSLCRS